MIKKLLIANRGEIACRIIETAQKMGIHTIAVFSEIDSNAKHRWLADEAYCIGPAQPTESYLDQDKLIATAVAHQADAIHPGYGFLSENPDFAKACQDHNLTWVGPDSEVIRKMGIKDEAIAIMKKAGLPIIPGFHDPKASVATLQAEANKIGFPLLIKATHGGGGKGMRLVQDDTDFVHQLESAQAEAKNAFGNDSVFLEKFLEDARHIEVQVLADHHGNAIHLFERDCSLQRRHQKIIETAPAHHLSQTVRNKLYEAALTAVNTLQYTNAGTVEFLVDKAENLYFIEMNTRLQVEHPITEAITGIDLVKAQLNIAMQQTLPWQQSDIQCLGWAGEVRLYAEDPNKEFLPTTGTIRRFSLPNLQPELRVDSGIEDGDDISIYYDPMLAKLIVYGETREQMLQALGKAVDHTQIFGVTTNLPFLSKLLKHYQVLTGYYHTNTIDTIYTDLIETTITFETIALAAIVALIARQKDYSQQNEAHQDPHSPWWKCNAWSLTGTHEKFTFLLDEHLVTFNLEHHPEHLRLEYEQHIFDVKHLDIHEHSIRVTLNSYNFDLLFFYTERGCDCLIQGTPHQISLPSYTAADRDGIDSTAAENDFSAPMPGIITKLFVKSGDMIKAGDKLLVLEAMKMAHTLIAKKDGTITLVSCQEGLQVSEGTKLLEVTSE